MIDPQIVAGMNNIGVALLASSRFPIAKNLIEKAIQYLKGELDLLDAARIYAAARSQSVLSSSNNPYSTNSNEHNNIARYGAGAIVSEIFDGELSGLDNMQTIAPSTSEHFVYSTGFQIIPPHATYSPDPGVNATIFKSLATFNLALVHHLEAIQNENRIFREKLKMARRLYLRCRLLLDDVGVPRVSSSGNLLVDTLIMALYTNLVHSTSELALYNESRTHFSFLMLFSQTMNPERYENPSLGSLLCRQRPIFLLNAVSLYATLLAAAA